MKWNIHVIAEVKGKKENNDFLVHGHRVTPQKGHTACSGSCLWSGKVSGIWFWNLAQTGSVMCYLGESSDIQIWA